MKIRSWKFGILRSKTKGAFIIFALRNQRCLHSSRIYIFRPALAVKNSSMMKIRSEIAIWSCFVKSDEARECVYMPR